MANENKNKYAGLEALGQFLINLREVFAPKNHSHTIDSALSSTSTNPVQNKVIDAEFDAVSTAMNILEAEIDKKADAEHNHDDTYVKANDVYDKSEVDSKLSSKADSSSLIGKAGTGTGAEIFNNSNNIADGSWAHAEGWGTRAAGFGAHAEGRATSALGSGAHAEGYSSNSLPNTITTSTSNTAVIETWNTSKFTLAKSGKSHVEGQNTLALSDGSHAEGYETISQGSGSHSEGYHTQANKIATHAEGYGTIADGNYQHTQGKYNSIESADNYAHIVGNGASDTERSNAHTLDWDGNAWYSGNVYVGGTSKSDAIKLVSSLELDTQLASKSDNTHKHDDDYDVKGAADAVQLNLNALSNELSAAIAQKSDSKHKHDDSYYDKTAGETLAITLAKVKEDVDYFFNENAISEGTKDTLKEIQAYITSDAEAAAAMTASINNKADKEHTHDYATSIHSHDDRYYTETEIDTKLADKADSLHSHTITDVSGLQSALDGKAAASHGTHVTFDSVNEPKMNGTAAFGTSTSVARADHIHPTDTSRASQTELDALAQTVAGKADSGHTHKVADITDLTATATELNYMDGVTASVQEQLDAKQSKITGAITSVLDKNLEAGKVVVTTTTGKVTDSLVDATKLQYLSEVTSSIQSQLDSKAASGHTHSYAGSSSVGGAATSANKLNANAGSETQPVYFADGIPVKTTYTLGKSVPSDAKFTDTTYNNATTTADGLMSLEDKAKLNNTNIAYGTCSTAAATAAKVVSLSGNTNWTLTTGSVIMVKFTVSNTASNVTLNVNSTGAYPIWYNNAEYTSNGTAYTGYANRVTTYMFNGTHWVWIANSYDTNTTYTNVKLGHGYATCTTAAATVAKVGTLSSYTLTTGGIVAVKFTNAVPASATLNINSKGAKSIYYRGKAITAGVIKAGDVATFIYSSQYHLISIDRWQEDIESIANTYATKEELNAKADSNTTYALSMPTNSLSTITLTGSDGSTSSVDIGVTQWVTQHLTTSNTDYPLLLSTASKAYGQDNFGATYMNSNIYANPSTGTLTATNFVGTATKATADANGNNIADTYVTKANLASEVLAVLPQAEGVGF